MAAAAAAAALPLLPAAAPGTAARTRADGDASEDWAAATEPEACGPPLGVAASDATPAEASSSVPLAVMATTAAVARGESAAEAARHAVATWGHCRSATAASSRTNAPIAATSCSVLRAAAVHCVLQSSSRSAIVRRSSTRSSSEEYTAAAMSSGADAAGMRPAIMSVKAADAASTERRRTASRRSCCSTRLASVMISRSASRRTTAFETARTSWQLGRCRSSGSPEALWNAQSHTKHANRLGLRSQAPQPGGDTAACVGGGGAAPSAADAAAELAATCTSRSSEAMHCTSAVSAAAYSGRPSAGAATSPVAVSEAPGAASPLSETRTDEPLAAPAGTAAVAVLASSPGGVPVWGASTAGVSAAAAASPAPLSADAEGAVKVAHSTEPPAAAAAAAATSVVTSSSAGPASVRMVGASCSTRA